VLDLQKQKQKTMEKKQFLINYHEQKAIDWETVDVSEKREFIPTLSEIYHNIDHWESCPYVEIIETDFQEIKILPFFGVFYVLFEKSDQWDAIISTRYLVNGYIDKKTEEATRQYNDFGVSEINFKQSKPVKKNEYYRNKWRIVRQTTNPGRNLFGPVLFYGPHWNPRRRFRRRKTPSK
jgi:hypothetical protein